MAVAVAVEPTVLAWARERAGKSHDELARRFRHLADWESGQAQPDLADLERYAAATFTPVAYLLLPRPPEETVPIADMRTMSGAGGRSPSANMLDTIYQCMERQRWYRENAQEQGLPEVGLVSSMSMSTGTIEAGLAIRRLTGFPVAGRRRFTPSASVTHVASNLEAAGILVMVSGTVGTNTRRVLDPQEFRGFTLADTIAPAIFVNGADSKAAQLFTLGHELAHLLLGRTALSNGSPGQTDVSDVERWCNAVAAEFLVPAEDLELMRVPGEGAVSAAMRLAPRYRASTLVILRRMHDLGMLKWDAFRSAYLAEEARLAALPRRRQSGGNFYTNLMARNSRAFVRELVASTLEGRTHYRYAFKTLGVTKDVIFERVAQRVGLG